MVSLVDGLFGVVIVTGVALCLVGYLSYRRWDQLGLRSFFGYTLVAGIGSSIAGVFGIVLGPANNFPQPSWASVTALIWGLSTVPWVVFAAQYTGRYTDVRWYTIVGLFLPLAGVLVNAVFPPELANVITSVIFLYFLAIMFLGTFLLIQSTYSYVHLSVLHGIALAVLPTAMMITVNFTSFFLEFSTLLAVGVYTGTVAGGTVLLGGVVTLTPFLSETPAVETIGRRTVTEETDDLILIVDGTDTIIDFNDATAETLRSPPSEGEDLAAVFGSSAAELEAQETVTVETRAGKRQYDPEVSWITDSNQTEFGAVLSLRDVSSRELREQRLSVLNRALRHNLRNRIDILRSHAEALDAEANADHRNSIIETTRTIAELSDKARAIDQFVSDSEDRQEVDITTLVETVRAAVQSEYEEITITTDLPDSASIWTNRGALEAAVESATTNAAAYAESSVDVSVGMGETECEVVVTDDGPGIPADELESLEAGTETPLTHGTGLGLWQFKWAVRTMGGEFSFETTDGTTVRFTVPEQMSETPLS